MRVQGEVRSVRPSGETGKYVDVSVLEDGASDSVKCWAALDSPGVAELTVGDLVVGDVFVSAKLSKAGRPYLNTQLRTVWPV